MASSNSGFFANVRAGPVDPMFNLKVDLQNDTSPNKIDLGAGVYRDEHGHYYEMPAIKKAKAILEDLKPGHDYQLTTGIPAYNDAAQKLVFGENCEKRKAGAIATCQTISGTGAVHLGAVFLAHHALGPETKVYVGMPAWGNYISIFQHTGLLVETYTYYDRANQQVDFEGILDCVQNAPERSIFVLQAVCHNPTGADLSKEQWKKLAEELQKKNHFAFFDAAYQGFASGIPNEDIWPIRYFVEQGFELLVCQSFSKNMGLYSERVGALHVVTKTPEISKLVKDQLRCYIRFEFSSSPSYGARLVQIVLSDDDLTKEWLENVLGATKRMKANREKLFKELTEVLKTPGDWNNILKENGLFSFLDLSPSQCERLKKEFHIYLPSTGRINVAGLNDTNIPIVARAINKVVT